MSGYKCVNYYDLCRLCTTSSGTRINIFGEEGKKKNISEKISECLPVMVDEKDSLPKIICETCITQVESIFEFRTVCLNSQAMLEGCINTATLQNGGKIYIKEGGMTLKNISVSSNSTAANQTSTINQTNSDFLSSIIQAVGIQNEDIQDVKTNNLPQYTITMDGKTLSSHEIEYKVEEIPVTNLQTQHVQQEQVEQLQIQDQQSDNSEKIFKNNSLAEFLKMKPNIRVTPVKKKQPIQLQQNILPITKLPKVEIQHAESQQVAVQTDIVKKNNAVMKTKRQKYNLILTSPTSKQQQVAPQVINQQQIVPSQPVQQLHLHSQSATTLVPTSSVQSSIGTKPLTVPDWKFVSAPNSKCFLPLTIKDSSNNDQQIVAQIDTKNLILPATYQLQMKLQPQLTIDGQQIVQLTPSSIPATISLAPSQTVAQTFQDHQMVTTSGIDAATSTSESEIMLNSSQITNNQQLQNLNIQSPNVNIQHIQTIQSAAVSLPQLHIKNVTSGAQVTVNPATTQQVAPQKLFNNNITVHRITNAAATLQQQQTFQQSQPQNIQKQIQLKPQSVQQQQQTPAQNQMAQQTTQVQYVQSSEITKMKPVKIMRTTKLTPAQAKQVAAQQIANKKITMVSSQSMQTIQKFQQNTITTQKLPVRRSQPSSGTQYPPLPTLTKTQSQQQQSQQQQSQQQQQHQVQSKQSQQHQQQHQQEQVQSKQLQQQRQNISVKKLSVKTSNSAFVNTTPAVAASLAKVNPETNLLECSVCSRGFKKKEHLAQHMKLHAGLRPFKCSELECTKAFSRKEHLMRHVVSHSGKKMFSCDMCQKFFSRKDNLNKHRRTHTEPEPQDQNVDSYKCDVCNKNFVVKMYFLQHKFLHEKNEQSSSIKFKPRKTCDENVRVTMAKKNVATSSTNSNKFNVNDARQLVTNSVEGINSQIKLHPQRQRQQQQQQTQQQQQQQQPQHQQQQQQQRQKIQHQQQQQKIQQQQQQQQQPQQQKNEPQLVQLQLPVATSNNFNGGTITISQADGTTTTTVLKTLGNHDATVLNLPTSLANYMQLNSAQFITTSGEIVGHIKIEK